MNNFASLVLKLTVYCIGLLLFCTKIPSDMNAPLQQNIGSTTLLLPVDASTETELTTRLIWKSVNDATGYDVEVSTTSDFSAIIFDSLAIDTIVVPRGLSYKSVYYWRVRVRNEGGVGMWSNTSSFSTFSVLPKTPVLISPPDNEQNSPIPLLMKWGTAEGTSTCHLQVAANSTFTQMVFVDSTLTDTARSIGGLTNNTQYYWRVRVKNPLGLSEWSTTWKFMTFAASLPTPFLKSPADGAIKQPIAPVVVWSKVDGATTYHIEISERNDFTSILWQDTSARDTFVTPSGMVENGTYYWHVRAKNSTGMSNWTNPWRFTTKISLPQTPVANSPRDGAPDQKLSLVLSWHTAPGAASYSYQVSKDTAFVSLIAADSGLADTSRTISVDLNATTYYWQVRSKNIEGTSAWSPRWSFSTFADGLPKPLLLSPTNGTIDVPLTSTLSWATSEGATTYEVQISTSPDFTTVDIDDSTLTSGVKNLISNMLRNSITYYWRVMAKNNNGTSSNWSEIWSFTTIITTPGQPVLISPADLAQSVPVPTTLRWNKVTGASSYHVIAAKDLNFTSSLFSDSTVTDTAKVVSGLEGGIVYYWKLRGKNANGYGNWSLTSKFTTVSAVPDRPQITSPVDFAWGLGTNPQIEWSAPTGATSYHLQVSKYGEFADSIYVVNDSTLTVPSKQVGPLEFFTKYYVRVKAISDGGSSNWSSITNFTTLPPEPSAPKLISPVDNANNISTTPEIVWSVSPNTVDYTVQVSTNEAFTSLIVDTSTGNTSLTLSELSANTTYYWRVKAANAAGSAQSIVGSFTTTRIRWSDSNTGLPQSVISWAVIQGAVVYTSNENGIFKSTDTCNSWSATGTGLEYRNVITMCSQGTNLFAGTLLSVPYLSRDSAKTWQRTFNGMDIVSLSQSVRTLESFGNCVFAGSDGSGVFVSADTGAYWRQVNNGLPATSRYIYCMAVIDTTIYIGVDDGVFYSIDKGASWTAANTGIDLLKTYSLTAIGRSLYCGTFDGMIYMSSNPAAGWTALNSGVILRLNSPCASFAKRGTYLFAGSKKGGPYLSIDNGITFSPVSDGIHKSLDPQIMKFELMGNRLIMFTDCGVFRTSVP